MQVSYGHLGIDINSISCSTKELIRALELLDENNSQVTRVQLEVDNKIIYIYHDTWSGFKKPSKEFTDSYENAISFACEKPLGKKRTQSFLALKKEIIRLCKN